MMVSNMDSSDGEDVPGQCTMHMSTSGEVCLIVCLFVCLSFCLPAYLASTTSGEVMRALDVDAHSYVHTCMHTCAQQLAY
jgi:hypothetical protein